MEENMKDILDKIKKIYEEKVSPSVKKVGEKCKEVFAKVKPTLDNWMEKAKPYLDKVKEFVIEEKRYLGTAGLFVVMVLVLVFFTGSEFNAKRIAKLNSIEVSGEDYVPEAEFEVDAYPELNALIKEYFRAYVTADVAALEAVASPVSEMEKSYITTISQFYEEYQNIKCYTKHGLSKDSYIVAACFDIKFTGQEVVAPSMVLFYVQTDADGTLYINNLYSDFNLKYAETPINRDVYTALRKYTTQDDYLELFNQIETDFNKLIKENNDIYQLTKRTIPGTRQAWEDTVYYVQSTEVVEGTESTEAPTPSETPEPEPTPEPEQTPEPEPTPEPEQTVEKVKVTARVNVKVRSGAGTNFTKIGEGYNGDVFVILGEETGSDGMVWYKIQFNDSTVGYIRSDFAEKVTE